MQSFRGVNARIWQLLLVLILLIGGLAMISHHASRGTVSVTGSATVTAVPDTASFQIGINTNGATPGAASYAAYAYYSGETFASKVLLKSSGSTLKNFSAAAGVTAAASLKVGFQFATQTGAWSGGVGSTYTLTITATVH